MPRAGSTGYCSICARPWVREVNNRLKEGWSSTQIIQYVKDKHDYSFVRQTLYTHKNHITAGQDKVVALAEQARKNPVIRKTTNDDFLEAVRDLGMAKIQNDPNSVTLSDALKATQILESKKDRTGDVIIKLAVLMTGNAQPVALEAHAVIDGEAVEVE